MECQEALVEAIKVMDAAAIELHALRADRDQWRNVAEMMTEHCGHDSHCPALWEEPRTHLSCECGVGQAFIAYDKAVRGD